MAYSDLTGICEEILDRPVDITKRRGVYRVQEHIPIQRRSSYRLPIIGTTIASILLAIGCHTTSPAAVRPFDPYSSDGSRNQPALSSDGPEKVVTDFDTGQRLRLDNIRSYGGDEPIPPLEPRLMLLPGDQAFEATRLLDNLDFTQLSTVRDLSLDPDKPVYVEDRDSKWSVSIGMSSWYPKLKSEDQLDMFGKMGIDIDTFTTKYRNKGLLSNGFVTLDRKIFDERYPDKLGWFFLVGYIDADIENEKSAGPLRLNVDLERSMFSVSTGPTYYPLGRPQFDQDINRFIGFFKGFKPYVEGEFGYSHLKAKGDISVSIFDIPLISYVSPMDVEMFYFTPWLGGEGSLSKRLSLKCGIGYTFTSTAHDDTRGFGTTFALRYKF
ncbi:MAG: hypothetical protein ABII01_06185 [Candidatus Woesearchaeota archaeon]